MSSYVCRIFPFRGFTFLLAFVCAISSGHTYRNDNMMHELAGQAQLKLNALHLTEPATSKVKKCEITISDEGFFRYRRTFLNGKQEYYSFNLSRLKTLDYIGNTESGTLAVRTMEDDVIVQTYNDRSGNVDSMSVNLSIMMGKIEPEDLNDLHNKLFEMKRLLKGN